MDTDGQVCFNSEGIEGIVNSYFTNIFSSQCQVDPAGILQHFQPRVTEEMNASLTKSIT